MSVDFSQLLSTSGSVITISPWFSHVSTPLEDTDGKIAPV
jgi:hypothetical protein